MPPEEDTSMRDDILESMKALESTEEPKSAGKDEGDPAPAPAPEPEKEESSEPEQQELPLAAEKKEDDGEWSPERPPSSWTPTAREKWKDLPEDIRKEIVRREEASVRGVRQLQERMEPVQKFASDMAPIFGVAKEVGLHPLQYMGSLVQSERTLRTAPPQAKFQEILRIAEQYGVPLRDIINKSVGEEILQAAVPQRGVVPPEVNSRIQQLEARQRQEIEAAQIREIKAFASDKEFFNDVRETMANLLESGTAQDLADAYEKACWATPEVRAVMIQRERGQSAQTSLQQRQAAARQVGAPASGAGKLSVKTSNEDESIEDTIRAAWGASAGRV
jgi:hypothetical protein